MKTLTNDGIDVWSCLPSPSAGHATEVCTSKRNTFLIGKDYKGNYNFIIDLPSYVNEQDNLISINGIDGVITKKGDSRPMMLLELKDKGDWAIFKLLCQELISEGEKVTDLKKLSAVLIATIEKFCEFYKKRKGHLTESKILGLIGELLFLKDIAAPALGWVNALNGWRGPKSAPQDFALSNTVVEIKTKLCDTKNTIQISSAEQLTTEAKQGYIHVCYLEKANDNNQGDSFTITELEDEVRFLIRQQGLNTSAFDALLELIYDKKDISPDTELLTTKYILKTRISYNFTEHPEFPKITLSNIKSGICRVEYSIDLKACEDFISEIIFL